MSVVLFTLETNQSHAKKHHVPESPNQESTWGACSSLLKKGQELQGEKACEEVCEEVHWAM